MKSAESHAWPIAAGSGQISKEIGFKAKTQEVIAGHAQDEYTLGHKTKQKETLWKAQRWL